MKGVTHLVFDTPRYYVYARFLTITMATIGVGFAHKAKESGPGGENMIESGNPRNVPFESSNQRMYMKKIVGFIGLAFLHLIVAFSSTAPWDSRQWQPALLCEFK